MKKELTTALMCTLCIAVFARAPWKSGVPDGELVSYIQWDGIVALRMEDDAGVTLAWVQDGRSFSLRTDAENAEEMAQSVRKTAAGQP